MDSFDGVVSLTVKPWTRTAVTAHFTKGHLIITDPHGEWLGHWSVLSVKATKVGGRIELSLDDEKVIFEAEDPVRFVRAIEAEKRHRMDMGLATRASTAASMWKFRVRGVPPGESSTPAPTTAFEEPDDEPMDDMTAGIEMASPRLAVAQKDVVSALHSAMEHWFDFYFLLGPGTDLERLNAAARGLQQTASHLRDVAQNLEDRWSLGTEPHVTNATEQYRAAVSGWSIALDLIAEGAVLDQQQKADQGFAMLAESSSIAEQVVDTHARSRDSDVLDASLAQLSQLAPARKIPAGAVDKAKQPWRRALMAAGSPFSS